MKGFIEKLEELLELGGTKRDIVFLIISGIALLISIFDLIPLPFKLYFAHVRWYSQPRLRLWQLSETQQNMDSL